MLVLAGRPSPTLSALAASLLGRPVVTRDVAEIHGWDLDRVQGAVADLAGTGLLVQDGTAIRLAHDLVRTAAASHLGGDGRTHELIASWLEECAGANVEDLLAAAHHRRDAGLATTATLQRILGATTRRMVGSEGLHAIVAMVDEVPPDDRSAVALARGLASLAGELGQHALALARWSSVADRLPDHTGRARAWLAASEAARQLERAEQARAHLRAARRVAPDDPLLSIELDTVEASLLRWLEHDLGASHDLTTAALGRARTLASAIPAAPEPEVRDAHLAALVLACVDAMQRDATDEVLALADEIADVAAGSDTRASVQAWLRSGSALTLAGRLDAAEPSLAGAWMGARRSVLPDLTLDVGSWLTWTRYLMGRLVEAEEVASECRGLATRLGERAETDHWLQAGRAGAGNGGVHHEWLLARAEASIAMAAPDPAPGPVECAIEVADRRGLQLEAVWGRLASGVCCPVDPDRAAGLLTEAAGAAERIGAATEARLAARRLRRAGIRIWHRPVEPSDQPLAGLTPREQEIAALVAAGASNLDIAQALFLSRKTIERHVSNIFVKLGVRNRAQLAAQVAAAPEGRAAPSSRSER